MSEAAALKVGDTVWFVPNRGYGQPRELAIKKVGRKWLTVGVGHGMRLDAATLRPEHYGAGSIYRSQEEHTQTVARREAWSRIKKLTEAWVSPTNLTIEQMRQIVELLS